MHEMNYIRQGLAIDRSNVKNTDIMTLERKGNNDNTKNNNRNRSTFNHTKQKQFVVTYSFLRKARVALRPTTWS
jgi:hypothetical protein